MINEQHAVIETVQRRPRRPLRILLRFAVFLGIALIAGYIGLAWYVHTHKKEVLEQVTQILNDEINGTLTIGKMEPAFLQGFPQVSIRLENVIVRDSLYSQHKQTLLNAGKVQLAVNILALARGAILIKKVTIEDATINLFTGANGYSNTAAFKKGKKTKGDEGGSFPELKRFSLKNVGVAIDNKTKFKLYKFKANEIDGKMNFTNQGWSADIELNTLVNSLAFNTKKGSFIKNQIVKGDLEIQFEEQSGDIKFKRNKLEIGKEDFYITARFATKNDPGAFAINIENDNIIWRDAANLLSPNITEKLIVYSLAEPISVKCDLIGNFNVSGDPLIQVSAEVKDNVLDTPGGLVTDCSFYGLFTNENSKGRGFSDENSAIKISNFKGDYSGIPVVISRASILDLAKPIITGNFSSDFDVSKLKTLIDEDLVSFSKGKAQVRLAFRADIVDFEFSKPLVQGSIKINDATVGYVPRNLSFKDIDVVLDFKDNNLSISKIDLKSGKSVVEMEGSIKNFLNLYYTAPEKIVLDWEVYSPKLHITDFIGFVGNRQRIIAQQKPKATKANFTEDINMLFEKSNINMKLRVNKLYYDKFYASDARADITITEKGVAIKNAALKHADGYIRVDGQLAQGNKKNPYSLNATVSNVNISKFFTAFDNFGMETLKADNLKGSLSSKAILSGSITEAGAMVPRTMEGSLSFTLKNGALLNFEPVRKVGELAFPNRDINNITLSPLAGKFDVKGDKVTIHPLQINSSVLNMDIQGIYSFGAGTNIYVDVPIRNPKRDEGITDKDELAKRRNRGIVLHLVAEDDKDAKVKVKLGRKKD
jgi:uncharacterized protein involved in outer membrane biogenesis